MDILMALGIVTEKSCDSQDNQWTCHDNKVVEAMQQVLMNNYQSKTYCRKDLSWLYFDDRPRVRESQQNNAQQSYIPVSVAYLTSPNSSQEHQPGHDNSIQCNVLWQIYGDKEQLQDKETSQCESRLQVFWTQCKSPNSIYKKHTVPTTLFNKILQQAFSCVT